MGMYIYRVTAKMVKLNDGRKAHVAVFAYKPYRADNVEDNRKMAFMSGCYASERLKLKSDLLVTLTADGSIGELYHNPKGRKTFYDDINFGTEHMPKIADLSLGSVKDFYVMFPAGQPDAGLEKAVRAFERRDGQQ